MLLTEAEAAAYLKVAKATLQQWRHKKKGPPYTKITGLIRYPKEDLETYINNHIIMPGRKGV